MKRRWVTIGCALLSALLFVSLAGFGWGLTGTRFEVGEAITFEVQDSTTWFWGCCCNCCEETMILGWRIVNMSEQTLYSVVLDTPAYTSTWQGTWNQLDAGGVPVAAGQYKLYVDTSAGTLSRCFSIYDRCACNCYSPCSACACVDVSSITNCACKVSLAFVDNCSVGCFPLFWWSGCYSSPCSSGCGCP